MIGAGPLVGALSLVAQLNTTPLSAIPWLDDVLAKPELIPPPTEPSQTAPIEVSTLAVPSAWELHVGVLTAQQTGFPENPWEGLSPLRTRRILAQLPTTGVPELRAISRRLLLATGPQGNASVSFARIDALIERGKLDEADALMAEIGVTQPEMFRRWFDISALTLRTDAPCAALQTNPSLAPSQEIAIYCHAQNGNWETAWLIYDMATALGTLPADTAALLPFYLDPDWIDEAEPPMPQSATPMTLSMIDSVGLPRPPGPYPIAFAHADLHDFQPIRARLHAAERLVRAGAIPASVLFALYRQSAPAASGGIWDRAAAVQAFDAADGADIAAAIEILDQHMEPRALRHGTAQNIAPRLSTLTPADIPTQAHSLIARYLLLAGQNAEPWITTTSPPEIIAAQALLSRPMPDAEPPRQPFLRAISTALHALARSDKSDHPAALTTLTSLGQGDAARLIAIQLLLL